ncbi:MAG TPA: multiheme c-type cytochrome [Planctomycetota bacterium]|nr:multiheme c-type cytochrome [Planctomycetota bacterium]
MAADRRIVLCALFLGAVASLGACGGKPAPSAPAVVQGDLHLLVLNRLQGFAEAIPCDPHALPPLAGAVQVRSRMQAEGQTAKLVLVGDTLQRSTELPGIKPVDVAVRARADVVLEALGAAQPDAWIPGAADILGEHFDTVLARCQTLGIPVLLSNVAAPQHPEIKPWLVFQAGTLRVGCLGLLPPRITDAAAMVKGKEGDQRIQKLEFPGASVLPPAETVERLAAELRAREGVQLVVAFSNLSGKGNSNLANEAAGLDFIIGSSENKVGADRVLVGGPADRQVAILSSLPQGEELGHALLRIVGGDMHLQDTSPAHTLPAQIAHDEAEMAELTQRYGTSDVDELARLAAPGDEAAFKRRVELLHENRDALRSYAEIKGSVIDQQAEPFADPGPDGPIAAALAGQGPAILAAYETASLKPPAPPEGEPIIPQPEACNACHPAQTAFWSKTAHAHAFDTLRSAGRQRDPECLGCHAAGYDDRGVGWVDPRYDGPLGGVTCWSCHRTQAPHAELPRQVAEPRFQGFASADEMTCEKCHNERRSPGFDRAQALPAVSCPPMRADEPPLLMAWQAALDQIAQRRQTGKADARDDYLQGRALVGLKRMDEGLPLLDKVAAANTSDTALAIEIARLLDRTGQSRRALDQLRDYLRHQSGDQAANWTYADLLLHATDPAVRDPAQAAQHISLLLPADATASSHSFIDLRCLQVEALFASGRAGEGGKLLDVLLRDHAGDARLVALREKLSAGR